MKKNVVCISRKVFFSSGVTDESSSPHGYGFNFELEVTMQGPLDPVSGLVINLTDLDKILKEVVKPIDHKHLFFDVEELKGHYFTVEKLARYCHERLLKLLKKSNLNLPETILKSLKLTAGPNEWVEVLVNES